MVSNSRVWERVLGRKNTEGSKGYHLDLVTAEEKGYAKRLPIRVSRGTAFRPEDTQKLKAKRIPK